MNRIVLVILSLLVGQVAFSATAYDLKKLSCTASNGVQFRSLEAAAEEGLVVETRWGFMTKKFDATLAALGFGVETGIQLKAQGGGETYGLELALNPEAKGVQTKNGNLYMLLGQAKQWVATVTCKVQLLKIEDGE